MSKKFFTVDGNYAVSHVAYMFSDVAAIYPITPSSNMAEYCDEMLAKGRINLFGQKLKMVEMQSEGGAAGAVHGSLQAGAFTTTFTASQGLLLMIPNMYKIAGELLPCVFHVSARSLACSALSIFGDHSDVMSARQTGYAMLSSASVLEAQDIAAISHMASISTSLPFIHFFDGFRTSHEIQKIEVLEESVMQEFLNMHSDKVTDFRNKAMNPNRPDTRGTAQNPDIYFQGREAVNKYYNEAPEIVQNTMDKFAKLTGRTYKLFEYTGDENAEKVIIIMGSGAETVIETVKYLNSKGQKLGVLNVRLYRPFSAKHFIQALPKTVKYISVLDRTKEPGSVGEPLYIDVRTVIEEAKNRMPKFNANPVIVGGRYGLSSKEFTPSMVKAVYDNLGSNNQKNHFTVGIDDDLTHLSLDVKEQINILPSSTKSCMFWGLGSDGTVGANKNSIKIIGDNTENYAQGYFVYDSKKSGGLTISHLRFGENPIKAPYLIDHADFIALHNQAYLGRYNVIRGLKEGGSFLLNSNWSDSEVWSYLPEDIQKTIIDKKINFYNIDALAIGKETGLEHRVNVIMQTAFFLISEVLPKDLSIKLIKQTIEKTYGRKGKEVVEMNNRAVDLTEASIKKVEIPCCVVKSNTSSRLYAEDYEGFIKDVACVVMRDEGNTLPVSKIPYNGTFPSCVSQYEKRGIASEFPVWISENCIQCNACSYVCPHAVIRAKQIEPKFLETKPANFKTIKSNTKNDKNLEFAIQVSPLDCTGCGSCVEVCPSKTKAIVLKPFAQNIAEEETRYKFFDKLPQNVTDGTDVKTLKGSQFLKPLFEFSGACAGCGETPYVKLVTQLYGNRMFIANATGCSSIYGGTAPFTPYSADAEGRGPAWANSLFEDNAEFGFGMQLAGTQLRDKLYMFIDKALSSDGISSDFKASLDNLKNNKADSFKSHELAKIVEASLQKELANVQGEAKLVIEEINKLKDYLGKKSFWIFGGDGWAYDIGYGGLDHVLAQGQDINVLVLDTEVYSNTGGQSSKSTPIGATAKFATTGKRLAKKDLGLMAMSYGYVYVASVSMGANRNQVIKAITEAEAYNGPSIIIAYSPCINHGINMRNSMEHGKMAVESGYWPLYRFNPELAKQGKNPLVWESKAPTIDYIEGYVKKETRFTALNKVAPNEVNQIFENAKNEVLRKRKYYEKLSSLD